MQKRRLATPWETMLLFRVEEQGEWWEFWLSKWWEEGLHLSKTTSPHAGRPHSRRRGHCPQPGLKAAKAGECCPVPGPWPTEQDVPHNQAQNQPWAAAERLGLLSPWVLVPWRSACESQAQSSLCPYMARASLFVQQKAPEPKGWGPLLDTRALLDPWHWSRQQCAVGTQKLPVSVNFPLINRSPAPCGSYFQGILLRLLCKWKDWELLCKITPVGQFTPVICEESLWSN